MNRLVVLTGASGSGKTAIIDEIRNSPDKMTGLALLNFDSIGVPSDEGEVGIREGLAKDGSLNNPDMMRWAAYLRNEAIGKGLNIIDTAKLSLQESVRVVLNLF